MKGSAPSAAPRAELRRVVTGFGFFALAFGSMIGVGWVTAVGSWLQQAGPLGAALAFLIGGALMLCIGLCYAEATPMLPVSGGEVAYSYAAFGTGHAFVIGWCLAFGYIAISGFEAISVGKVLGFLLPDLDQTALYEVGGSPVSFSHLGLAGIFTVAITVLQYRGVAGTERAQRWMVVAFSIICLVFIVVGIGTGQLENARPFLGSSISTVGWSGGLLVVLVTVPFWFVGFDTIPQAAEEAAGSVKPRRLAVLIVASIAAATAFYALIVATVALVGPWTSIVDSDLPAATAFTAAFGSPLLARLVLVAALLGLFTSWNGFFLAGSRVLFALGRGNIISPWFGETHPRFGTPHRAVVVTGALTLFAPLMGRDALLPFVNAGSFLIAIAFMGVALSVCRLRRSAPGLARPFKMAGGDTFPILAAVGAGALLAAMIIPGSPAALAWPQEIAILGVTGLLATLFWFRARRLRTTIIESQRAFLILEQYAPASKPGLFQSRPIPYQS